MKVLASAAVGAFLLPHVLATPRCCWSKWGDQDTCGNYTGSGGVCNTDPSKKCNGDGDCPATPPPPPPPPGPPTPAPPTPPPMPPSNSSLPDKVVGLYLLVADDGWPYKSDTKWVPKLPEYMTDGGVNVLWLAFVNPSLMPALPPAMEYIGKHRPKGTQIIASVGGEAYSEGSFAWPWLDSVEAAEAMAAEVVQWKTKYGVNGIDLDIEGRQNGETAYAFAKKVKELDPNFIVTQPVFGSPQITEENYMVNHCFAKGARSAVDSIGIMVYEGTGSLQYVKDYTNGSSQWSGFPIKVDVPPQKVILGAGGQSGSGTIETLAKAVHDQDLGGIMVWYASIIDSATGKVGNQYGGGSMDSSIQSDEIKATWKKALDIMHGRSVSTESIVV